MIVLIHEQACDFTLDHYGQILKRIVAAGYEPVRVQDVEGPHRGKVCIVRHDVDLDPLAATAMGRLESQLGIKSSYYFLLGSPLYNPFSAQVARVIEGLCEMGHEIGLHYDGVGLSETDVNPDMVITKIDQQCRLFEQYFSISVRSVSFHRPSPKLLEADLDLGQRINTYSRAYFQEFLYVSDSSRRWRRGCACRSIPESPDVSVQLLTHPEWWNETAIPKQERLWQLLSKKFRQLDDAFSDNVTGYERFCAPAEPSRLCGSTQS